jgi:hypothetical protein
MSGARRTFCAVGVLMLLLTGCAGTDFFSANFLQAGGGGRERVVAGSLESVSQSTQATLRQLGFATVLTEEAQGVRIACTTQAGRRFFLLLTRVQTDKGESTRIAVEWEGSPDERTSVQVLSQVESQHRR